MSSAAGARQSGAVDLVGVGGVVVVLDTARDGAFEAGGGSDLGEGGGGAERFAAERKAWCRECGRACTRAAKGVVCLVSFGARLRLLVQCSGRPAVFG